MKLVFRIMFVIGLSLLLLEGIFRFVDPFGYHRYFTDLRLFVENLVDDDEMGIMPLPGQYQFSNWILTIREDGRRVVADTSSADCTLAFMGDSVTFGWGSDDTVNFVNRYAAEHDNVFVTNGAMNGYNIDQIADRFEAIEADAYVYLVTYNDDKPPYGINPISQVSALYLYMAQRLIFVPYQDQPIIDGFTESLNQLVSRDDTLVIGFDGHLLTEDVVDAGGVAVEPYTSRLSQADEHPDALGHEQIYEVIRPLVEQHVAEQCSG